LEEKLYFLKIIIIDFFIESNYFRTIIMYPGYREDRQELGFPALRDI